ncbi:putative F-box protein At1g49610 [Rutidosis leptorrhynchoides]|uniref:putative F-box protein At1g49610 n=1 Tax=Rutidosis leptorrhynchoides TaxID=125765 RepID=UPI003A99EE8F
MNADGDRLSNLSEDLIIKILSFNDTKQAVRTSILSSRWRNIWKSIPHLDLSSDDITSLLRFSLSVTHVLSSRNDEIELSSVKLSVRGGFNQPFFTPVLSYAYSHNVQKMTIIWSCENHIEIPLSLFISRSLKDLTLIGSSRYNHPFCKIKSSWDLPALTTLHLEHVIFNYENHDEYGGLFSQCLNLKNLTLYNCTVNSHSSDAKMVAHHLKNLTVVNCKGPLLIYAPELSSLMYRNPYFYRFSADGLSCLEKVDFYMSTPYDEDGYFVIQILQQFRNVKFLTLGLEIVELLSVNLVSDIPSPFTKLKSMKIYPGWEKGEKKVNIPTEIKNFLLNGSPNATASIYSREDVKALKDATSAQQIMAKLQRLLVREKINCETNLNVQGETQQIDEGQHDEEEISQMRNCWTDLFVEINEEKDKIDEILSMLDQIHELLKGLPASSKKERTQAQFYSLHVEAKNVMKLMLDYLKVKSGGKVSAFMNML